MTENIKRILNIVILVFFGEMAFIAFLHIVTRYVVSIATPWSKEISRIMVIYFGFIGVIIACGSSDEHGELDALQQVLSKKLSIVVEIVTLLLSLIAVEIICYGIRTQRNGWKARTTVIPYGIIGEVVPVTPFILSIQTDFKLIQRGLGYVAIAVSVLLVEVSKLAWTDTSTIRGVKYHMIGEQGNNKKKSMASMCSSSDVDLVIPPRIPMAIYGIVTNIIATYGLINIFMNEAAAVQSCNVLEVAENARDRFI